MQVISGRIGREQVHFEAPPAGKVPAEMNRFLTWFNTEETVEPVLKALVAHVWFVTIHPFEDGNGRIARALTDLLLARSESNEHRYYSFSSQIRKQRDAYYMVLEDIQKGDLDITEGLVWFLRTLIDAVKSAEQLTTEVLKKAHFWESHKARAFNDRQRKILNLLMDSFEGKLTSSKWAKLARCSQDTANRDINDLLKDDILKKDDGGGRSTSYSLQY
ncbi:Fic family protein [Anaeromusa acidaminophila]|uniref:Fic family protein n=1 Tax=Anaeromusa acidaminophila TaxID=81464 RepID=UPI00037B9053|nr:Fic family protein [Anaeromusa acidaminophila]